MSVMEVARSAGLRHDEAVAAAAKDWLTGPGRAFLGLKASEVSALRRVVSSASEAAEVVDLIEKHLNEVAKRRKGASRWDRPVAADLTLLGSLRAAIVSVADVACPAKEKDEQWIRVLSQVERSCSREQQEDLKRDSRLRASIEFLNWLVRAHQGRKYLKEGGNPCQKRQAF